MATRDPRKAINQISVAIDTSLQGLAALETAATLAARLQASLEALFVEDSNLFHLAELPFARELISTSGEERTVDATQMTQALQEHAHRVRRALTAATRDLEIASSLKIVRGQYMDIALGVTHADVVFMCGARGRPLTTSRRRVQRLAPQRPVYVLYDASPAAKRALALADEAARYLETHLIVLLPVIKGKRPATLQRQAERSLNGQTVARYVTVPSGDADSLNQELHATGCALVVVPREHSTLASRGHSGLLDTIDCPLVLVA